MLNGWFFWCFLRWWVLINFFSHFSHENCIKLSQNVGWFFWCYFRWWILPKFKLHFAHKISSGFHIKIIEWMTFVFVTFEMLKGAKCKITYRTCIYGQWLNEKNFALLFVGWSNVLKINIAESSLKFQRFTIAVISVKWQMKKINITEKLSTLLLDLVKKFRQFGKHFKSIDKVQ